MKKLVIDSSVIVKWLHEEDEQFLEQAKQILDDVRDNDLVLIAPELAKYEVGNALLSGKKVSLDEVSILFDSLYSLPLQFIEQSSEIALETYKIAQKSGNTYYDASFMALAQKEKAILITDNIKHQGKTADIKVLPLSDYSTSSE
jgi:predicted nucleic acid-binding protein